MLIRFVDGCVVIVCIDRVRGLPLAGILCMRRGPTPTKNVIRPSSYSQEGTG